MPAKSEQSASTHAVLELDRFLPYRLSVLSNRISQDIAQLYAARFALSVTEWRVLAVLGRYPDLSANEVAERTAMDKVTVSRAAQGLLKRRLVERASHEADGRSHRLSLSQEGARLHGEIAPLALAYEAALLSGLAPGEVTAMKLLLKRLEAAAIRLSGEGAD